MYTAINLVRKGEITNQYGDLEPVLVRRQVFAEERSVGMTEVYQAMAVGYKPEVKFKLENFADYHGEELVEYRPFLSSDTVVLRVLRTYRDGDGIELTCYAANDNPKVVTNNADTEESN